MPIWLPKLVQHLELDVTRLNEHTRTQLLMVSPATIDRMLKPTRDGAQLVGLDTDNGGEFINHALIKWAGDRDLFFTRSRPYKSNDNAHVEQKNGDVVRRHAFHYRYDTALELQLLNELYALVRVRLNLFTATTKAIDWRSNKHGKKTRVYDKPRTPYQRVFDSGILTAKKTAELATVFEATNPAEPTRRITTIQTQLIALAKDKTEAVTAGLTRARAAEARNQLSRAS